jgi:F0F1-type ATP synthase assembly protein I
MMKFTVKSVIASIVALIAVGVAFGTLTDKQAQSVTAFVLVAAAAFNPTHKPKS